MTKTLYVPEHVKEKIQKEKTLQTENSPWVTPENRVLDPSLLKETLLNRLPQPTGWRVLVMPYQGKAQTSGGIIVPDEIRE